MVPGAAAGSGRLQAASLLKSGAAAAKFMAICAAQGGFREPGSALHRAPVLAATSGRITDIDNRLIARIAKLAGAPRQPNAGVVLLAAPGDTVSAGEPLFEIHAETPGELAYAKEYAGGRSPAFTIAVMP